MRWWPSLRVRIPSLTLTKGLAQAVLARTPGVRVRRVCPDAFGWRTPPGWRRRFTSEAMERGAITATDDECGDCRVVRRLRTPRTWLWAETGLHPVTDSPVP